MDEIRVLLVEPDDEQALSVQQCLQAEGMSVYRLSDGVQAIETIRYGSWDAVLMEVALPGKGGLEICRSLRAEGHQLPILFLTSRSTEVHEVRGFDMGCDDYLAKPFKEQILVARVSAAARRYRQRSATKDPDSNLRFPGLQIDGAAMVVRKNGQLLDLRLKEFTLLKYLAERAGRVVTKQEIFRFVWDTDFQGGDETLTVHIRRLRQAIEDDPSQPVFITTVRGKGYRFNIPGWHDLF